METMENSAERLYKRFYEPFFLGKLPGKPTQNLWRDVENFCSLFPKNSPMQFAKFICKEFLLQVENQTVEKASKQRENACKKRYFSTFPQPIVFCFSKSAQRLCKGLFHLLPTAFPNLTKRFSNHFSTGVENLVEKQKKLQPAK